MYDFWDLLEEDRRFNLLNSVDFDEEDLPAEAFRNDNPEIMGYSDIRGI